MQKSEVSNKFKKIKIAGKVLETNFLKIEKIYSKKKLEKTNLIIHLTQFVYAPLVASSGQN